MVAGREAWQDTRRLASSSSQTPALEAGAVLVSVIETVALVLMVVLFVVLLVVVPLLLLLVVLVAPAGVLPALLQLVDALGRARVPHSCYELAEGRPDHPQAEAVLLRGEVVDEEALPRTVPVGRPPIVVIGQPGGGFSND